MPTKQQIANYLSQSTRNRLVFSHALVEDLQTVNVGKELAEALSQENLKSPVIAYAAEDILLEMFSRTESDATIGSYLAITNIGILFEPALGINIKSTIDNASRNKTLIVCSEGEIANDRFYYMQQGDGIYFELNGFSYLEL